MARAAAARLAPPLLEDDDLGVLGLLLDGADDARVGHERPSRVPVGHRIGGKPNSASSWFRVRVEVGLTLILTLTKGP